SVAVMVVSIAFITGFKFEIREKLFSFWGHVLVTPYEVNASNLITPQPIRYDASLVSRIKSIPQVKHIAPWAARPGILQHKGTMEGIRLKGIGTDFRFSERVKFTGGQISYADTSYSKDIIISSTTAARMQLKSGDDLQLYFLEPGTTSPRIRKVHIAGIFHTGMDEIDKDYALCDIRLLQRINNWSRDEINGYQIDLHQEQDADTVAALLYYNYLAAPLSSYTMKDVYINIFDWLKLQDINAEIVLIIMALVAIINLAVALLILIVEQARMVGLLKALGMTATNTQQIFFYYAALIAGAGIFVGNLFGLGLCLLQQQTGFLKLNEATYYMSEAPVRINGWYILIIDVATLTICMLCMWLPSLYIRRIQPSKVLQFK
ncbi:MAG: ABC transporter permease, partial [Sphingobacteriales bacterium]